MELLDTDELMILPTPRDFIFDIISRVYIWISACCFQEYLSSKDYVTHIWHKKTAAAVHLWITTMTFVIFTALFLVFF